MLFDKISIKIIGIYHNSAIKVQYSLILDMSLSVFFPLGLFICAALSMTGCKDNLSIDKETMSNEDQNILVKNSKDQMVSDPMIRGFEYAKNNDPRALQMADSLIRHGVTEAVVSKGYYLKGVYFTNTNKIDNALSQFDSSILSNFTFTDPYIEKGILLYEMKKFELAVETLGKAAELDRYNPEIYFWMAKNYESQKNYNEAKFYYEQTILLDQQFFQAKEGLERISINLKKTDKK